MNSTIAAHPTPAGRSLALLERHRRSLIGLGAFAVLVVGWQIIAMTQPPYVFPSLVKVLADIWRFALDGILLQATLVTAKSVVIGATTSMIVGMLIGFALARFESFTAPLLNFVQTVPYVVWALMAMIWFGLSQFSVVFTIFVAAFPIVSFNVAAGLKQVDGHLVGMAQSLRANRYMT